MKLFWKIFNLLFIWVLLSLSIHVKNDSLKESSATTILSKNKNKEEYKVVINQHRLMTKEEKKKYDEIKKPDIPEKLSDDILFMQKELDRTYKEAFNIVHPRFKESAEIESRMKSHFPEDKREVGVPVLRDG